MIGLIVLLVLMIIAAIAAVEMRDLLSSVIAVGAVGLGLSVAFLLLQAPDLAITQLVVEILCLIILIRLTIRREGLPGRRRISALVGGVTALFIIVFLMAAWSSFRDLPPFGAPLMRVASYYISQGQKKTGAANLVSAVILDFRAYDTLGEVTVLFAAVMGTLAVLRRVGRKPPPPERRNE